MGDISVDDGCLTEDITMTELLLNPAIKTLSALETSIDVQNKEEMMCAGTTPFQNVVTWKNIKKAAPNDAKVSQTMLDNCPMISAPSFH